MVILWFGYAAYTVLRTGGGTFCNYVDELDDDLL